MKKLLLKISLFALAFVLLVSPAGVVGLAEAGDIEVSADFSYTVSNQEVTIVRYDENCTVVDIPETVKGYPVVAIGYGAFYNCKNLSEINLPESLRIIEDSAFSGCSSLTSINIPKNVTYVESYAFGGCTSLAGINVSEENPAFASIDGVLYCKNLYTTVILSFCPQAKTGSVTIPEGVDLIASGAFFRCQYITDISIPNGTRFIGSEAFYACTALTELVIPDSVKTIGYGAFSECIALKSVTLPQSINSIDGYAFVNCPQLTIYGYEGSYAQKYASSHGIPFFTLFSVTKINISPDSSPKQGVPLTFTAESGGGQPYKEYFAYILKDGAVCQKYLAFSNPVFNFTPEEKGLYQLKVYCVDGSNTMVANTLAFYVI
ncbi:MAG: leucine-rich repeat domain-containing protein [Oscillospiraceae bacterium]|jgi:hypothetical protein|nr:leucine-rich repeat domain-containing protein [Oscillospiraceae bacterium]